MQENNGTFLGTTQSGYSFDAETERGAISSAHIRNLTAEKITSGTINGTVIYGGTITGNQISGGTLTLGGTANGDGVMEVYDASGNRIIRGDNTGHHYYNTGGTELIRVNDSGLHAYTGGTEYIKVDSTGLHGYATSGTEVIRVDQVGFHSYTAGTETFQVGTAGIFGFGTSETVIALRQNVGGSTYGQLGYSTATGLYIVGVPRLNLYSGGTNIMYGGKVELLSSGNSDDAIIIGAPDGGIEITASDNLDIVCNNFVLNGGTKTAIVPTSQGYRALYTNESPDVWFMDFASGTLSNNLDPLFVEVTRPPYHYIQCVGGEYQVWGKRKGFENIRFEEKTEKEFEQNNKFWDQSWMSDKH